MKDRKSTRLNSSHLVISYAVFCLKKKTAALVWAPIERHLTDLLLHRCPTFRQPEFGLAVATVGDELGELAAGHRSFFFFNDTATTEIYTLSLHDALPI